ncbi:MGMT family protein [Marinomonas atlantica]|uniref:MGMT family protein n=1 Tax=Marinomonas atlantica TaxID=1806668 RepID=UPI00082B00EE|nr:MGMT family protein [Marinomonas atlantica]MCO4784619.1 MGMT family protein [Marinomonas atlantica]
MANQETEAFKVQVLFILAHLPSGDVISYGELAKQAGNARYARLVARILKQLPNDTNIPWHRVINSKQRISFNENSDAYFRQKSRLENEGWQISGQRLIQKEAH